MIILPLIKLIQTHQTEVVVFSIDGSFTASVSVTGKDPKVSLLMLHRYDDDGDDDHDDDDNDDDDNDDNDDDDCRCVRVLWTLCGTGKTWATLSYMSLAGHACNCRRSSSPSLLASSMMTIQMRMMADEDFENYETEDNDVGHDIDYIDQDMIVDAYADDDDMKNVMTMMMICR